MKYYKVNHIKAIIGGGKISMKKNIININPLFMGQLTQHDLIKAIGILSLSFNLESIEKPGYLFEVNSLDYYLKVGFTEASFYIKRNNQMLEMLIEPYRQAGPVDCYAMWHPNELNLLILHKSDREAVSSGVDDLIEIERRRKFLKTPPIIPPNSLIAWARKEAIVPIITYNSSSHFYQEVTLALQSIQDKVESANMYENFWENTYEGSRIVSKKPIRETTAHTLIHGLIFDIAIAKNFEVYHESQIGSGRLDFLISGHLKSGENVNVCVEFKHAHNTDLKDGLLKQLPAYMRVKGCNFGLYCVMWFKDSNFTKPKKYDDITGLDLFLDRLANSAGFSNIRTLIFDFAHPTPPSQL